jgi:general secretion pathway protein D
MKTLALTLLLLMTAVAAWPQNLPPPMNQAELLRKIQARRNGATNNPANPVRPAGAPTQPGPGGPGLPGGQPRVAVPTPFANPAPDANAADSHEEMIAPGVINFEGVDVNQVLDVYAQLVNRTLLRATLPQASIILKTQTPLTKTEAIEALKAVLALNNIAVVDVGDKFVKVSSVQDVNSEGAPIDNTSTANLPELGSYVTHIVQLRYVKPSEMLPIIQPFAKLQNSILPIDSNGILVLRDFAENVKRMLEMIDRIDVSIPAEYISEVIPIRYAQAEDIANALNSLGGSGGGGGVVNFGSSTGGSTVNGFHGPNSGGGMGGGGGGAYGSQGGYGSTSSSFGQNRTTANGTPSSGSSFQQRLNSIVGKAGGGGDKDNIQVFGQAKIIADSRSNSLLIFATKGDMVRIKKVIDQLDVLLAQVLIEAVIMDVSLSKALSYGVSAAQNPHSYSPTSQIVGGGGMNNGQPFANFLGSNANYFAQGTNVTSSLGSGFSYFGNIGPSWDVALAAAASDSSASVIQRPRIQTSQAKQATFFVGETVPYVTSSYSGGGIYGNNASYSQLSVGVELDVTPFINPDGLVVMDINQEIDDIVSTTSDGALAPTTSKRTLSSEIAVKDKDTIILGGFIRSDQTKSRSGVPILEDIPLLGNLFSQHNNTKDRQELLVLMRPTVLTNPDKAEAQTLQEEKRLPGIDAAAADDAAYERQLIEAQRKADKHRAAKTGFSDSFYNEETNQTDGAKPATTNQTDAAKPVIVIPGPTDAQIKAQGALPEKMNSLNSTNTNGN